MLYRTLIRYELLFKLIHKSSTFLQRLLNPKLATIFSNIDLFIIMPFMYYDINNELTLMKNKKVADFFEMFFQHVYNRNSMISSLDIT